MGSWLTMTMDSGGQILDLAALIRRPDLPDLACGQDCVTGVDRPERVSTDLCVPSELQPSADPRRIAERELPTNVAVHTETILDRVPLPSCSSACDELPA